MLLALSAAAALQAAVDPVAVCEAQLRAYTPGVVVDGPWSLALETPSGGALTYVGAEHSRDPDAEQFAQIEAAFRTARPSVVFYEGPDRGVGEDGLDTIRTRGESGYVRWLAAQAGAATRPLEPPALAQFQALSQRLPRERVELFFVLRETARLRDREALTGEALDTAVASLLGKLETMLQAVGETPPFADIEGLEAAYRAEWRDGSDWRDAPEVWFQPGADDEATGGRFMAAVNRASSEYRNVHMYRMLAHAALDGERVFAVVGRNHVPMQTPALTCALGEAES